MCAMDGERFLILPITLFFHLCPPLEIFREYQESLTVHRAYGVGHRNERLQLTESFPEPPERRFQRFELPVAASAEPAGGHL